MQATQAKYARERIEEIFSQKMEDLKARHEIPRLTLEKKLNMIINGEINFSDNFINEMKKIHEENVKIDKGTGPRWGNSVYNPSFSIETIWDFSLFDNLRVSYRDEFEIEKEQLIKAKNQVLDLIYLSDEATALSAIEKFAGEA